MDFTKDAKNCQPTCDEQFPFLRTNEGNSRLVFVDYNKEFDFQFSDISDKEMTFLIDLLPDSSDVHSQDKFDVGETRQNFMLL